ncbi:MAG: hypothetical protein OXI53_07315 [Nitrospira sp.]|nr:hypothetical protein [Nitrospira sp.]MDE0486307.1 hypothetical protein [Nitrospira sp.]
MPRGWKPNREIGLFGIQFLPSTRRLRSHAAVRVPRRLRTWSRSAVGLFLVFGVTVSFVPWT